MTDAGLKPRRIKRIAVLGGGLMGSGIATASILAGVGVLLKEINPKFLEVRWPPDMLQGRSMLIVSPCGQGMEVFLELTLPSQG